jgi:hypothetical protein
MDAQGEKPNRSVNQILAASLSTSKVILWLPIRPLRTSKASKCRFCTSSPRPSPYSAEPDRSKPESVGYATSGEVILPPLLNRPALCLPWIRRSRSGTWWSAHTFIRATSIALMKRLSSWRAIKPRESASA